MTKIKATCLFMYALAFTPIHALPGWDLVWSDEFDVPGKPDSTKWHIKVGASTVNGEAEYYTDRLSNIHVADGNLYITALKENYGGRSYTSGRMDTEGKAFWTYGRFEIKAKLPGGKGSWPAYWMEGHDCAAHGGWPDCGEIDIAEYAGKNPNYVNCTMHMRDLNYMLKNNPKSGALLADVANVFHVYAIEWYKDRIDFFYDSTKVMTFRNDGGGVGKWPYFNPQYIILNEALGGGYGGTIDNSIFPTQWVIDYVRVYQQSTATPLFRPAAASVTRKLPNNEVGFFYRPDGKIFSMTREEDITVPLFAK